MQEHGRLKRLDEFLQFVQTMAIICWAILCAESQARRMTAKSFVSCERHRTRGRQHRLCAEKNRTAIYFQGAGVSNSQHVLVLAGMS